MDLSVLSFSGFAFGKGCKLELYNVQWINCTWLQFQASKYKHHI